MNIVREERRYVRCTAPPHNFELVVVLAPYNDQRPPWVPLTDRGLISRKEELHPAEGSTCGLDFKTVPMSRRVRAGDVVT
jgi:hypothetical protein